MDDALRAPVQPVDNAKALPTARTFAHMPTASYYDEKNTEQPGASDTPASNCATVSSTLPVTGCGTNGPVKCDLAWEATPAIGCQRKHLTQLPCAC